MTDDKPTGLSVQPVSAQTDAAVGKAIRDLWQEGRTVTVQPRGKDNKLALTVMDMRPDEDDVTVIVEVVPAAGSSAKCERA